ncbi:MAG TPA: 5-oxoprolinase subunit PxpA [Bacillota bacterium]|nr:5-oxoprolinase subunit PxpA [Bacillota bacterium]
MAGRIDLNADLGEGFGRWTLGPEELLLPWITSASVACGFHAGDPRTIRRALALAAAHGVAVGAHPGYPDLAGFGRRELEMDAEELRAAIIYQVGAVQALARAEGLSLQHVKAHGALYNRAARDPETAAAVVSAVLAVCPEAFVLGPPGSVLLAQAGQAGLTTAAEGFADRAYRCDGTLAARSRPGAVLDDPRAAAAQALRLVREGKAATMDGIELDLRVESLCVHGDTPGAPALAKAVREALAEAGVEVRRLR